MSSPGTRYECSMCGKSAGFDEVVQFRGRYVCRDWFRGTRSRSGLKGWKGIAVLVGAVAVTGGGIFAWNGGPPE